MHGPGGEPMAAPVKVALLHALFATVVFARPHYLGAAEMQRAREVLSKWTKPALVMFSDGDPITRGGDKFFRSLIRTGKNQPKIVIRDAGHFLQEEKGDEIARYILACMARTKIY